MMSLPDRTIFGKPPDRTPAVCDTSIGAAPVPFAANRRNCSLEPCPVRSIQLTTASPVGMLRTSTRPTGFPPSTRIFFPNVFPESLDIMRSTSGLSPGAVNHAAATLLPLEETAGPLIGHPSISHPSLLGVSGTDHLPPAKRE